MCERHGWLPSLLFNRSPQSSELEGHPEVPMYSSLTEPFQAESGKHWG